METQPVQVEDLLEGEKSDDPRLDDVEMDIQSSRVEAGQVGELPLPDEQASMRLNALGDELTYFDGKVQRTEARTAIVARMLLDCGASHTFVSLATAKRIGGRWDKKKSLPVSLPNGETLRTQGSCAVNLHLGEWSGRKKVWAIDIAGYDVILGNDFLKEHSQYVSFPERKMWLGDKRTEVHGIDTRVLERKPVSSLNLLSKKDCRRALRDQQTQMLLCTAKTTTPEASSSEPRILKLLQEYQDVFPEELPKEMPPRRSYEHYIDTRDADPVNRQAYPLPADKLAELKRQVADLLERGLIETSSSPWGFPVIFVKKPEGAWRMCIDYRALNELTAKNGYPLPRIQDLLDIVGKAKYLSKIDLASGYWQVRLSEDAVEKTAFNTIWGKYQWRVMPFGLCNAPATFQTMMNETLRDFLGDSVVVYLDDILVFSESLEEHCQHLRQVLGRLRKQRLYAKPSKCVFATTELEFCGHILGNGKLRPIAEKVEVILSWPRPKNAHEVRSFLGLATYYRRFVKDFAKIAAPLSDLLKAEDAEVRKRKYREITWNEACELAFRDLKQALVTYPVLIQPDVNRPFIIESDASEWAIGYSLVQIGDDGKSHPVAFDGRKLQGAELNYPVQEKELLAVKEALRTWDRFVDIDNGLPTTVITDHQSLQYLASTQVFSKRLARWIDEFQDKHIKWRYRPGKEAIVPDAISRRADFVEDTPANVAQGSQTWATLSLMTTVGGFDEKEWYAATVRYLLEGTLPEDAKLRRWVRQWSPNLLTEQATLPMRASREENTRLVFRHHNGVTAPYMEPNFRLEFLQRMHREYGHLGHPGLQGVIAGRGWWPSMRKDIEEVVRMCPNCQVSQKRQLGLEREASHYMTSTGIRPFERWGLDLIGLLPTTPNGNRWILTAIDYATGWPIAEALQEATQEKIGEFIHNRIFIQFGAPKEFLTDNGTNLLSDGVKYYIDLLKSRHRLTTPYHPRTNGKVENLNGLLGRMLSKYLMGKPTRLWDEYLPQALFAARVREHATTGSSPFYLVYGQPPRLPGDADEIQKGDDVVEIDRKILAVNHARSKANEDLLYKAVRAAKVEDDNVTHRHGSLAEGMWVLVRNEAKQKFESNWFGPYKIIKANPLGTYALAEPGGRVLRNLVNGRRLVNAHVSNPNQMWTTSGGKWQLRRQGDKAIHPFDGRLAVDKDSEVPPSYLEMSTISRKEWEELIRSGVRSRLVGEDQVVQRMRKRATQQAKRKPAQQAEEVVPDLQGDPAQQAEEVKTDLQGDPAQQAEEVETDLQRDPAQQAEEVETDLQRDPGDRQEAPDGKPQIGLKPADRAEETSQAGSNRSGLPGDQQEAPDGKPQRHTTSETGSETTPYSFRHRRRWAVKK
jgi:transposase InsO family protein